MIFFVQRYLEDYFERRGLSDSDQYAIRLANAYAGWRHRSTKRVFLQRMSRVQTVFFRANPSLIRAVFRAELLDALDRRFAQKKSLSSLDPGMFPGGLAKERASLVRAPLTIRAILDNFRKAVERQATGQFWRSRQTGVLAPNPEKAGQNLLAMFATGALADRGIIVQELKSGVGYVDIAVVRGHVMHLLELKVLRAKFRGVRQLSTYMKTEDRSAGWLVLFDARPQHRRSPVPMTLTLPEGTIRVVLIDIRPEAPSRIPD